MRSIVGEFPEHSRVFGFANGGAAESCLGSADLMERDLDRRVGAVGAGVAQRTDSAASDSSPAARYRAARVG